MRKSRRCTQRRVARQRKRHFALHDKLIHQDLEVQRCHEAAVIESIRSTYGFVADPTKSVAEQAMAQLAAMPSWLYFTRCRHIAFHNLCVDPSIVSRPMKSLLALGLSFIPRSHRTKGPRSVDRERFQRDCDTRLFFAGDNTLFQRRRLFVRSAWRPDQRHIPKGFSGRISTFCDAVAREFRRRRSRSNLLPEQRSALRTLMESKKLLVARTDKNLGPAILERDVYVRRAFDDHLSDASTYRSLTPTQASNQLTAVRRLLNGFIARHFPDRNCPDRKYLLRSIAQVRDPFAYFYLILKIHKNPWTTRPIVSVSGSLLHSLGCWIDQCLQVVCKQPATFRDP